MLVVSIVLGLLVVAMGVLLTRSSGRLAMLEQERDAVQSDLDAARASLADAARNAELLERARDDALERAARARRDASEVAKRMKDEAAARAAAEQAVSDTEAERARLRTDLDAAKQRGGDGDAEELWSLALAGVRRTWEVSVSPSPGMPSPLEDAEDQLRAAIQVEVDAAREEAGASVELEWHGDVLAPVALAVRVLSLAQAIIARLAKSADEATLSVHCRDGEVELRVTATDQDGEPIVPVEIDPEHQTEPGTFLLRLGSTPGD